MPLLGWYELSFLCRLPKIFLKFLKRWVCLQLSLLVPLALTVSPPWPVPGVLLSDSESSSSPVYPPPQETRSWSLEVAPGGHPHLGQQNPRVCAHIKARGHRASTDRRTPGPPSGHSPSPEAFLSLRSSPEVLLVCRVSTRYWVQRPGQRRAISSPAYGPKGQTWGQIDPANCVPFELVDFVNLSVLMS